MEFLIDSIPPENFKNYGAEQFGNIDRRIAAAFNDTERDLTRSRATDLRAVSADIAALPDAYGYSTVYDLRQAMARDSSGVLKDTVRGFTEAACVPVLIARAPDPQGNSGISHVMEALREAA
jgi:hypothetical protein